MHEPNTQGIQVASPHFFLRFPCRLLYWLDGLRPSVIVTFSLLPPRHKANVHGFYDSDEGRPTKLKPSKSFLPPRVFLFIMTLASRSRAVISFMLRGA